MLDEKLFFQAEEAYKNAYWISTAFSPPIDCYRLRYSRLYAQFFYNYGRAKPYNLEVDYKDPRGVFDNPHNIIYGAFVCVAKEVEKAPEKHTSELNKQLELLFNLLLNLDNVEVPHFVVNRAMFLGQYIV